ncbi:MAG: alpha/beta fold hydrolase [Hyphomonas sp.]|nr:alpha/beta fold hydrolase [Hyphomonas sp.]
MMDRDFRGFGGLTLRAGVMGVSDDPSVLLVHAAGQSRAAWRGAAEALAKAGRHVISLDLRGHGASDWAPDGRYDFEAFVEDLRAVLAQLASRPVILGAGLGGWAAAVALGEDGGHMASGLILVESQRGLDAGGIDTVADALKAHAAQGDVQPDWDTAMAGGLDLSEASPRLKSVAGKIRLPVLVVRRVESEYGLAGETCAAMEQAELIELQGANGPVAFDRADVFNATVLDFLERRVPRFLPDYRQGSDARTLRDAMGCFATGVTVVTAIGPDGEPVGLTANSFTSVSLEPPLLLVCIAKTSASLKVIEAVSHFAVNVLHIGQQPVSAVFARAGDDRFSGTPWQRGHHDTPLIAGALANFECSHYAQYDGGDHVILVGRVERATYEPRRDPLLYYKGRYRRLHFA